MDSATVIKISGPLVVAKGMKNSNMFDVVKVGKDKLLGEIIEIHGDEASIQVYEETAGLKSGSEVVSTNEPLNVELGPGLIGNIFDGIQRSLTELMNQYGCNIKKGADIPALNRNKQWVFEPCVTNSERVYPGDIIGFVQENDVVRHKIMIPPHVSGIVKEITAGTCTIEDVVAIVLDEKGNEHGIGIMQKWPVRRVRPYKTKLSPVAPLLTGQRALDSFFPLAKGGIATILGPFGSGKTIVQQQIAKWSDADIVIYIGCGERGNEITEILNEFPNLVDIKTGKSIADRTIFITNTSDMPVAAREASIYTGTTIAEYFRDMGYNVVLLADSTSRWAEALREMSNRLHEMPAEEGYPAYLGSRLAQFYERAGRVIALGRESREGTLSIIGAVSPAAGDISEPVSQATLRIVKTFWGLDSSLAHKRHFPAVDWLNSYSLYSDITGKWFSENVNEEWITVKNKLATILSLAADLEEMVKLVGAETLSGHDRLKLEIAHSIREDFLQQESNHEVDTYSLPEKQFMMMKLICEFYDKSLFALENGAEIKDIATLPIRESIGRFKYVRQQVIENTFRKIMLGIEDETKKLVTGGEN